MIAHCGTPGLAPTVAADQNRDRDRLEEIKQKQQKSGGANAANAPQHHPAPQPQLTIGVTINHVRIRSHHKHRLRSRVQHWQPWPNAHNVSGTGRILERTLGLAMETGPCVTLEVASVGQPRNVS